MSLLHRSKQRLTAASRIVAPTLLSTLLLLTSACSSPSPTAGSDDQAASDGTTARTIREEAPTTTASTQPTTTVDLGPLPEPDWIDIEFELQPIASTNQALAMTTRPGGDDLWLVEREGRVRLIQRRVSLNDKLEALKLLDTVVLDITDNVSTELEGGLLGLDFSTNGEQLYISYTNNDGNSVVAEYQMDLIKALERTERIILEVEQPHSNHNGGQITFGPDGFLYFALGDGGSGGDPLGNGQDTTTLLGSMLRIDPFDTVDDQPYRVPDDNPFAGGRGDRHEIWAYGLRNPWRFSFDHQTGDIWIGDVGQSEWEEIDFLPAGRQPAGRGANLGWKVMEGTEIFDEGHDEPTDHVSPVHVYSHDEGRCSVTGGYVYRGDQIDILQGVYIFGDFCSGELFGLKQIEDGRFVHGPINVSGSLGQIVSFGQGPEQEIYILEANGDISRLQVRRWDREVEIYGPDEEIPGGRFTVDITPGPDDPVINEEPVNEGEEVVNNQP